MSEKDLSYIMAELLNPSRTMVAERKEYFLTRMAELKESFLP